MKEQPLLVETQGYLRCITLNRPDVMNAITPQMLAELNTALKAADDASDVRVIVLTGAGRAFCSGLDLKQAATGEGIAGAFTGNKGANHYSTREICTVTLQRMDTPVIAAINGPAAGYGLDLALGCDMRLMSDQAKLLPGFAKMAVIPESGGTWYLPRLLGWAKACEVAMLGDPLNAEKAAEFGLINKVVKHESLMDECRQWAEKISANAPLAIQEMKRLFRHGLTQDFESHSHHVLLSVVNLFNSNDFNEAINAYTDKRPAVFKGN